MSMFGPGGGADLDDDDDDDDDHEDDEDNFATAQKHDEQMESLVSQVEVTRLWRHL